jgi:hypothetical protein
MRAKTREDVMMHAVSSANEWKSNCNVETPIHERAIISLHDCVTKHESTIQSLSNEISDNEILISQLRDTIKELETPWYTKFLKKIKSIKLPYLKVDWR